MTDGQRVVWCTDPARYAAELLWEVWRGEGVARPMCTGPETGCHGLSQTAAMMSAGTRIMPPTMSVRERARPLNMCEKLLLAMSTLWEVERAGCQGMRRLATAIWSGSGRGFGGRLGAQHKAVGARV